MFTVRTGCVLLILLFLLNFEDQSSVVQPRARNELGSFTRTPQRKNSGHEEGENQGDVPDSEYSDMVT